MRGFHTPACAASTHRPHFRPAAGMSTLEIPPQAKLKNLLRYKTRCTGDFVRLFGASKPVTHDHVFAVRISETICCDK